MKLLYENMIQSREYYSNINIKIKFLKLVFSN